MKNIFVKIKRDINVRLPVRAFAVIENGPDAFDYVTKVFFSSKNEHTDAGKFRADVYCSRVNGEAVYVSPETSYNVAEVTDYLTRYYWGQGEPAPC